MLNIINIKASPITRGHAVKLEWENPNNPQFKEVVIHRRTDDIIIDPLSPLSVEVYRGKGNIVFDYHLINQGVTRERDIPEYSLMEPEDRANLLIGEQIYYYIFYAVDKNGDYHATTATATSVAPTKIYGLGLQLYQHLPPIYREMDNQEAVLRLCKLVGEQMDFMFSKINMNRQLLDPMKVNTKHIHLLANNLGWRMEPTLPILLQRRLLQNAVQIYKYAGTRKGLSALVRYVSGFPSSSGIMENFSKIFRTVFFGHFDEEPLYLDSITPIFDELDTSLIGLPDDPLFYIWDFSPNATASESSFVAYVRKTVPLTPEEEQVIKDRITRALNEFIPVGAQFNVIIY